MDKQDEQFYVVDSKGVVLRFRNGEPCLWERKEGATEWIERLSEPITPQNPHFIVSTLTGQIVYPKGFRWPL